MAKHSGAPGEASQPRSISRPIHLTGGEASDSRSFEVLLDLGPDVDPRAVVANKGYDAKTNREAARKRGTHPPPRGGAPCPREALTRERQTRLPPMVSKFKLAVACGNHQAEQLKAPRTSATTDRGNGDQTRSICAICLPAAYRSPRRRLEAWPLPI
jgi:hypothetical protein